MAKRLLVVDDEPAVREILAAMLEASGYEVVATHFVSDALRLVREESFAVALLDVHLPGSSGWTLLEAVRESSPGTRVLMISDERHRSEAARRGADGYLAKPYTRAAVESAVRRLLDG